MFIQFLVFPNVDAAWLHQYRAFPYNNTKPRDYIKLSKSLGSITQVCVYLRASSDEQDAILAYVSQHLLSLSHQFAISIASSIRFSPTKFKQAIKYFGHSVIYT